VLFVLMMVTVTVLFVEAMTSASGTGRVVLIALDVAAAALYLVGMLPLLARYRRRAR
jgi:hypothetical protein